MGIEIIVSPYPKKEIQAVCKNCNQIVHLTTWGSYLDFKKKKAKFDKYKVCTFCNKKDGE